jgi:hypothetical protein
MKDGIQVSKLNHMARFKRELGSLIIVPVMLASFQACSQSHNEPGLLAEGVDSAGSFYSSMEANRQWPSYRGYFACGFLDNAQLPDSFNISSGYNVLWQRMIPGLGLSCPVIWDERVFVTTAISEKDKEGFRTGLYGNIEPVSDSSEHRWMLYCIHRRSGKILWEEELHRGIPSVKRHP